MPSDSELIKIIFMEAIDKTPQGRHAYIEAVCGTDAELKRKVNALLVVHDEGQAPLPAGSYRHAQQLRRVPPLK
jgi:hypothetical protein